MIRELSKSSLALPVDPLESTPLVESPSRLLLP